MGAIEVYPILSGWVTSRAARGSDYKDSASNYDQCLPEVTLSAADKTGQEESTIPVLRQRSFTGRALPSTVADIPCASLGVDGMLEKLNAPACIPGNLSNEAYQYFVDEKYDLGTAYAHLCYRPPDVSIGKRVTDARKYDDEMRRDLLEKREIREYAPPRRVWDLYANRVVPWWAARNCAWVISHAWVANDDLKYEMTPINGYQWPVPMPKDADLDRIRIEMLNLGAEYVWLDVLCLRQKGQGEDPRGNSSQEEWNRREILHEEEWKVDLPIVGWVYHNARQVACYLSGLGLPLSFKTDGDFENERCWFNRAWTLQETPRSVVIAGKTCGDDMIDERFMTEETQKRLEAQLEYLQHIQQWTQRGERIFHFLAEMKKRKSSNLVDKVAGLVYLLRLKRIPIYGAAQSDEDTWTDILNVADGQLRASFLFLYPKPSGNKSWRPSWEQIMTETLPNTRKFYRSVADVGWIEKDGDSYYGPRMEACHVRGLADESNNSQSGTLNVKNSLGEEYTFDIFADHACPIPDGLYTLLGAIGDNPQEAGSFWVVGKVEEPEGKFRKVSVVRMAENPEAESLEDLDVYKDTKTFLL